MKLASFLPLRSHSSTVPITPVQIMKINAVVLASIILFSVAPGYAAPRSADAFDQNRKLGRGVNIIGYDPIWRSRAEGRFQARHFRLLKEAGFNSVRINLFPFDYMDATNGWTLRKQWFETLDWAVKNAHQQGLQVILDLHEFGNMGDDPAANKEKFLAFWRQLSAHYPKAPASVYFEVLNEPSRKMTAALWNEYLREALAIIREKNPTRTVIIGPAFWNSIDRRVGSFPDDQPVSAYSFPSAAVILREGSLSTSKYTLAGTLDNGAKACRRKRQRNFSLFRKPRRLVPPCSEFMQVQNDLGVSAGARF